MAAIYPYKEMLGGGLPEGMDPEMAHQKSAFNELQYQGMGGPAGMGHPAYPIRTSYPGHPSSGGQYGDGGLTSSQSSRLGYPFSMNHMSMSPGSYNSGAPAHPFSMPPYHQTSSPPREGMYPCCIVLYFKAQFLRVFSSPSL